MSKRREEARLRIAAEAGDMDAASDLADMLADRGDFPGAVYWNRLAADRGHQIAALNLGMLLGEGGNWEEGIEWLKAAATSKNAHSEDMTALAAGTLGKVLLHFNKLDEAERWLSRAASNGSEEAKDDLEELARIRATGTQGGMSQGSGGEVLQTFEVSGIMLYDGSGHRLGPSLCTLTKTRFVIEDARGGISQILIPDISDVSTPARLVSPKMLRIHARGVAYDIYCESKDQKDLLANWLSSAIRGF